MNVLQCSPARIIALLCQHMQCLIIETIVGEFVFYYGGFQSPHLYPIRVKANLQLAMSSTLSI